MTEFENLDSILILDLYGDPWNDDAYFLATEILNSFTPSDWGTLNSTWPAKKESWKALLADALSGASPEKSLGILLNMIASESDAVADPAIRSLAAFRDHVGPDTLTSAQKERISRFAEKSTFNKNIVRDLMKKIALDQD